jgi:hypothetical protein
VNAVNKQLLWTIWNAAGQECLLFKLDKGYDLCLWDKGRTVMRATCASQTEARRIADAWKRTSCVAVSAS